MAQFAKGTFPHASYAAFRRSYPTSLYNVIFNYHRGRNSLCVDLGTGHGIVARSLAPSFTEVIGTDPSDGMIQQARSLTPKTFFPGVRYERYPAENLTSIASESVDMVVSGQAAHWFEPSTFWPEMKRVIKPEGTIALWCYTDPTFITSPKATKLLMDYAYGDDEKLLGPYWQQPGRSRVQNKLRDLIPPAGDWDDVKRVEYEPVFRGEGPKPSEDTRFFYDKIKLGDCMNYVRTWSSFHGWQEKHPDIKSRQEGGTGDVVDEMFEAMVASERKWRRREDWENEVVEMERGSGLLLARRK